MCDSVSAWERRGPRFRRARLPLGAGLGLRLPGLGRAEVGRVEEVEELRELDLRRRVSEALEGLAELAAVPAGARQRGQSKAPQHAE